MKVLGIERNVVIDFHDNKSNRDVHLEGIKLHLGEERKNVEGTAVEKPLFVSKERNYYQVVEALKVGDEIKIGYNRFGSVDFITKA